MLYTIAENIGTVLQQLLGFITAMASSQSSQIFTACSGESPTCVGDRETLMHFILAHRRVKYSVFNHLLLGNWVNQQVAIMLEKTEQVSDFYSLVQNLRSHIHSTAILSPIGLARKMRRRVRIIWLFLL